MFPFSNHFYFIFFVFFIIWLEKDERKEKEINKMVVLFVHTKKGVVVVDETSCKKIHETLDTKDTTN